MGENIKTRYESVIAKLDYFIFVKKSYSLWKHLIPFSIAALLLLMLSIPEDNLLLQLARLLQRPSLLWLPASLLTLISIVVYYYTIKVQIRQAYLWSKSKPLRLGSKSLPIDDDFRRTVCTSFAYIILCTLLAYVVLWSIPDRGTASSNETIFGDFWASFLLAILSLTGIGWEGPNSWVESIGIKSQDYSEGRLAAKELTNILKRVRNKESNEKDVEDFLKEIENLQSNIKTNLEFEPEWTIKKLEDIRNNLLKLSEQVKVKFSTNNEVGYFAIACRRQSEDQFEEFIEILNTLSEYWEDWYC